MGTQQSTGQSHSGVEHRCPTCLGRFATPKNLARHVTTRCVGRLTPDQLAPFYEVLKAGALTGQSGRKACRPTAKRATAGKTTAAHAKPLTVIVRGIRRQRSTLIDVPQLSETELCAVIRNGVCADLAWAELKSRGDRVRYFREVLLPQFKQVTP